MTFMELPYVIYDSNNFDKFHNKVREVFHCHTEYGEQRYG